MDHLNASQLRTTMLPDEQLVTSLKRNPITIILDDVLDTYNIGSIFRLADAVSAEKVYLCGLTQTPPNSRIKKASVNTWSWVPWEYKETAVAAIDAYRASTPTGKIIAVEQDTRSMSYYDAVWQFPVAIVVGNESTGVHKETLAYVDTIVELPMFGINTSMNVMVTTAIVLFDIIKQTRLSI
jgi:tRNA G18 (ribose-2'-O)-methylase SpoU